MLMMKPCWYNRACWVQQLSDNQCYWLAMWEHVPRVSRWGSFNCDGTPTGPLCTQTITASQPDICLRYPSHLSLTGQILCPDTDKNMDITLETCMAVLVLDPMNVVSRLSFWWPIQVYHLIVRQQPVGILTLLPIGTGRYLSWHNKHHLWQWYYNKYDCMALKSAFRHGQYLSAWGDPKYEDTFGTLLFWFALHVCDPPL